VQQSQSARHGAGVLSLRHRCLSRVRRWPPSSVQLPRLTFAYRWAMRWTNMQVRQTYHAHQLVTQQMADVTERIVSLRRLTPQGGFRVRYARARARAYPASLDQTRMSAEALINRSPSEVGRHCAIAVRRHGLADDGPAADQCFSMFQNTMTSACSTPVTLARRA
jgi:hypothetical protein